MIGVRDAVERMIRLELCTEYTVRFWHADRTNTAAPHYGDNSNPKCEIFDREGGKVSYEVRPQALAGYGGDEYVVSGAIRVLGLGTDTSGDTNGDGQGEGQELLMLINVPRAVCLSANTRFDIPNPGGEPPDFNLTIISPGLNWSTFPYHATGGYNVGGSALGDELWGHRTGCFVSTADPELYTLYQVLWTR